MNLAINLAKKNIGKTADNPSVGCVITQNHTIIATGVTSFGGRPHAEAQAISKIKDKNLSNLTMYVTLEPCFHQGKTPPCVKLIDKKVFSRIVISCQDPDSRVNEKSISYLKKIGINVEIGILQDKYKEANRAFFKSKLKNKPFISLKIATTIDGKIATQNFESKWISCEKSRQYTNLLRAKNNAILIGSNSIKKDNPSLDCRISGAEKYSATPVIMSNSLDLDLNYQIFKKHEKIIIATNNEDVRKQQKYLKLKNLQIIKYDNLSTLLENLVKLGINSILIEGGSMISASFLKEDLVDEIIHIQSGKILGKSSIDAIGDLNISQLAHSPNFSIVNSREYFSDKITIWEKSQ